MTNEYLSKNVTCADCGKPAPAVTPGMPWSCSCSKTKAVRNGRSARYFDYAELGKDAFDRKIDRAPSLDCYFSSNIKTLSHADFVEAAEGWLNGWDQRNVSL